MRPNGRVIFLLDLLQDVAIIRPLAYLVAFRLKVKIEILMSAKFVERDRQGVWQAEAAEIAQDVGALLHPFATEYEAYRILEGKAGVIIAASESNLSAHTTTHNVFRIAPASFLRISLQHGFECIGFLQSREHDKAHGRNIAFAADVICGWCEPWSLTSTPAGQRSKLYITGPATVLRLPPEAMPQRVTTEVPEGFAGSGIVCENLHSVRLQASGDFRESLMDTFFRFCERLAAEGENLTLRPHPAGQYVVKKEVPLPGNVRLENQPIYKISLADYSFGISAPSTVLIDMILAGIPAAVWQDQDGVIDIRNYEDLTTISTMEDWLAFRRDVAIRPGMILDRQRNFLSNAGMVTDPVKVEERFLRLLGNAPSIRASAATETRRADTRILFVSNGFIPTLQLSFLVPLAPLREAGEIAWELLSEELIKEEFGTGFRNANVGEQLKQRIDEFEPTLIVFCRYSGPHSEAMVSHARLRKIPCIYHVDDDLLNIPIEIGERKYLSHNHPSRLNSVRHLLGNVDLVYCSTEPLLRRFRELGFTTPMAAGKVYCAGSVINPAVNRPVRKIGYMGFDHAHDFQIVIPALVRYLRRHPEVTFELFGSVPRPDAFDEFGDRVRVIEPVRDYRQFLETFAGLGWDIGLCPLADTRFNAVKANTKWVEYTSIGATVVAMRGTIYDACTADGCGLLAQSAEEWYAALEVLTGNPDVRYRLVMLAQERLAAEYSVDTLRAQIQDMFTRASANVARPAEEMVAAVV